MRPERRAGTRGQAKAPGPYSVWDRESLEDFELGVIFENQYGSCGDRGLWRAAQIRDEGGQDGVLAGKVVSGDADWTHDHQDSGQVAVGCPGWLSVPGLNTSMNGVAIFRRWECWEELATERDIQGQVGLEEPRQQLSDVSLDFQRERTAPGREG